MPRNIAGSTHSSSVSRPVRDSEDDVPHGRTASRFIARITARFNARIAAVGHRNTDRAMPVTRSSDYVVYTPGSDTDRLNVVSLSTLLGNSGSVTVRAASENRSELSPQLSDTRPIPRSLRQFPIDRNPMAPHARQVTISQSLPNLEWLPRSAEEHLVQIENIRTEVFGPCSGDVAVPVLSGLEDLRSLIQSVARSSESSFIDSVSFCVATWYPKERLAEILSRWEKFNLLDGATEFGLFIEKLKDTPLAKTAEARTHVIEWLDRLSESKQLSEAVFLIARESTNSCHDSVWLTFSTMQQSQIGLDAKNGKYDTALPELVARARVGFRLECINRIAAEKMELEEKKAAEMAAVGIDYYSVPDEIEVYLGLQVKLNQRLELNSIVTNMLFYDCANLTDADIDHAAVTIKQKENSGFVAWLVDWDPYVEVLTRLDKAGYDDMQEQRGEVYSTDAFTEQCDANAKKHEDVTMNAGRRLQIEANFAKDLGAQLTEKIKTDFANTFFRKNNEDKLLAPKWPLETQVR